MKNKNLTYLLILAVMAIWGIILRRVVTYTDSGEIPAVPFSVENNVPKASFGGVLVLDYRDPFLEEKTIWNPIVPRALVTALLPEPDSLPAPPDIRFRGVIRQGGKLYAILETGTHSQILRQGEAIDEHRVSVVTADSVVLKKENHAFILKLP